MSTPASTKSSGTEECSICLCGFDESPNFASSGKKGGAMAAVHPPCQHMVHYKCAVGWFEKGGPQCPVCNQDVRLPASHTPTCVAAA